MGRFLRHYWDDIRNTIKHIVTQHLVCAKHYDRWGLQGGLRFLSLLLMGERETQRSKGIEKAAGTQFRSYSEIKPEM